MKEIIIIAGIAQNNVIGTEGDLPWHISEDLKRFKQLTFGNSVIMGRKTYESIIKKLGKPLPDRKNIVLTRQENFRVEDGVDRVGSIEDAISKAAEFGDKIFVIGGQQIYEQTIDKADRLEITKIHKNFEGDAHFPDIDYSKWERILQEEKSTKDGETKFSFLTYKKIGRKNKGIFIVFEGIDGCGKSTQIRKMADYIFRKNKYNHVVLTRNPYKDLDIRKTITGNDNLFTDADKLANLFINDRKLCVEEIIKPNTEMGHFVVCDRYKLSTISYQAAQGLVMEDLIKRHEDLPVPDMTFVIDISPEIARERMQRESAEVRGKEHKFEAHLDFARKLRKNHFKAKELLEARGEKVFIINGERTPNEIFEEIKGIFEREIKLH